MAGQTVVKNPQVLADKSTFLLEAATSAADGAVVDMSLTLTHGGISQYSNHEFKSSEDARKNAVASVKNVAGALYVSLLAAANAYDLVDQEFADQFKTWLGDDGPNLFF